MKKSDEMKLLELEINKRKQVEKEKEKLEAKLRQAHKMEAIGTLAGGIAHDFNNILAILINANEMASLSSPEESKARYYNDMALQASHRAKELVKQLLAFSRRSGKELAPLKLDIIVKENMKLMRATIPATIRINQNIESGVGYVNADPTKIHQLIMNLCTNAIHAMDEKGVLSVTLREVELSSEEVAHRPELEPGLYILLSVKDTGCGIKEKDMETIFEPFFTTKEAGKGTGMGLSVVNDIVEEHNGMIQVESEPGEGTMFHMYFPVIEPGEAEEGEESGQDLNGNESILFVDDEVMVADSVSTMLKTLGYDVWVTSSSTDALNMFQANPDAFDLVITDQAMPDMSGIELASELLAVKPEIPIILCTGYSSKISEENAEEFGLKAFLYKPYDMNRLVAVIKSVLDKSGQP